ncbi:MAG: alkyl hydroperoxide reductase subunit F [Firmicutes bacterium]|nr:alkyl hydroperoxide reductase subunit F [Bacillota bacterium]
MILEQDIIEQLKGYVDLIENPVVLGIHADPSGNVQVEEFANEVAALSSKISVVQKQHDRVGSFSIDTPDKVSGIVFAGLPLGHEFGSFVMALLQVSGRPPKIEENQFKQIASIKQNMKFVTYVSLSCHNCPDVVQALNIMSLLNDNISHTMVEGSSYQDEVNQKNILAVPSVTLNGNEWHNGRMTLKDALTKLGVGVDLTELNSKGIFDVLVIGGGPSGSTAAIYASRKGIKTGIVSQNIGGQILDTLGIENIIGTKYIEGPQFAAALLEHIKSYPIDIIDSQQVEKVSKVGDIVQVELSNGAKLQSKSIVVATGAKWREIGVPGEKEFKAKGISFCPHCDGPLYKGKDIAIIGAGNSGLEAALDLSPIVKSITIIYHGDKLKGDKLLQDRLAKCSNVKIILKAKTTKIDGDTSVKSLNYIDIETNKELTLKVDGIFILIGLVPSTGFLKESGVNLNPRGEIVVDRMGATNVAGIYAAGDCTDCVYKQIVVGLGGGATAALSAYDYIQRLGV